MSANLVRITSTQNVYFGSANQVRGPFLALVQIASRAWFTHEKRTWNALWFVREVRTWFAPAKRIVDLRNRAERGAMRSGVRERFAFNDFLKIVSS